MTQAESSCGCKSHPIFGHEDGCRYEGMGSTRPSSGLPDPNLTGPCQARATFMCTGEARGERLHPLSMLPDSKIPADYVPMCPECHDHLADMYVAALHGRAA